MYRKGEVANSHYSLPVNHTK